MKKTVLLLLLPLMLAVAPCPVFSQGNDNQDQSQTEEDQEDEEGDEEGSAEDEEGSRRFWQAILPGGNYMVALDRVSSVSMHSYVLNTQLLVNEVVIDTNGRALARFYHVTHAAENAGSGSARTVVERGRQVLDRAGQRVETDVHNLPQKDYPATSHAGMIEYRILNLADLKALHKSLQSAWESGRRRTLTIR